MNTEAIESAIAVVDHHLTIENLQAIVFQIESHIKTAEWDLDHYRSLLRAATGCKNYKGSEYKTTFLPGFFKAIPSKRVARGLIFKRRRLDPYMKVREVVESA